ncbi:MAG: hypothetical protein H7X86_05250 [Gorillibacterium sp.]|nr:hypothetical protein [Gorillibacterium sp.]
MKKHAREGIRNISFRGENDQAILIVTSGDAKVDNKKFRQAMGMKARMLTPVEVLQQTGHEIGGVCPFGLTHALPLICRRTPSSRQY